MTRILDINPSYTQTVILDNDSDADLTQVNRDMRITQQAISLRTCKYLHRSRSTLQQTEYPIFYKCQCAKTIQIIAIDHQKKSRIQITTTPGLVLTPLKYLILLAYKKTFPQNMLNHTMQCLHTMHCRYHSLSPMCSTVGIFSV